MELLGDMGAAGHGVKEFPGCVLGVAGHEANPVVSGNPVDVGEQVRKVVPAAQVVSVGVHVLAQQGDVPVPGFHQLPDL